MGFRVASSFKRMKKQLSLILIFLLLGAISALAQEKRHNLSLSIGGPVGGYRYIGSDNDYYQQYGNDLKSLYKDTESVSSGTALMLGYSYRLNRYFALGGDLTYGMYTQTLTPGAAKTHRETREYVAFSFTFVPNSKVYYYSDEGFDVYLRAGLGAEFSTGSSDGNRWRAAWQITPLGIHVGKKFYYIGELGVGTEYILRMGIGYSF